MKQVNLGRHFRNESPLISWLGRLLIFMVFCWGAWFCLIYFYTSLMRVFSSSDFDWIEQEMMLMAHRFSHGLPIYTEPSATYVPPIYPPIYAFATALMLKIFGPSFVGARFISWISTLLTCCLLWLSLAKITLSRSSAFIAVTLFLASYAICGFSFESARIDSLALFFTMAAFCFALRTPSAPSIAALGGFVALSILAIFTKQTAIFPVAAIVCGLILGNRKRGLQTAACIGFLIAVVVIIADIQTDSWFGYYLFKLPAEHPLTKFGVFLSEVWSFLIPGIFLSLIGGAGLFDPKLKKRNTSSSWLIILFLVGLFFMTALPRVKEGGGSNNLAPMTLAIAFGGGLAWSYLSDRKKIVSVIISLIVLFYFSLLAYDYEGPLLAISSSERLARVTQAYRVFPSPIFAPADPYLPILVGNNSSAHWGTSIDIFTTPSEEKIQFLPKLLDEIAHQKFTALIFKYKMYGEATVPWKEIEPYYRELTPQELKAVNVDASDYFRVFVPRTAEKKQIW